MKLLKQPGMEHANVRQCRAWLAEQGFTTQPAAGQEYVYDLALIEQVKAYQRSRLLDDDGVVGPLTWTALERDHLKFLAAAFNAKLDVPAFLGMPARPQWAQRLQRILDVWAGGAVGYGTPQDSRSKMLKRPVDLRLQADPFDSDERQTALTRFGTTHTCGGCSSLASRVVAGVLGDAAHRAFTNQTGVKPPPALRYPPFKAIGDNIPDAMLDGDATWQASGWRPTCRGYAPLFDHLADLDWQDLHEAMRGVPLAILHLQGGHVICAFWSDHQSGMWYSHPLVQHQLLMDDECYILAADGWSGAVGQPTTLQRDQDRLSKKHIDHLWRLRQPMAFSAQDNRLQAVLA